PCLVVLVRVRDRFRELCSELENDQSHDKPDHEYSNVRDGYGAACDVLADTRKAEHNRLDNYQYNDARDQTNERRHDWSNRSHPASIREPNSSPLHRAPLWCKTNSYSRGSTSLSTTGASNVDNLDRLVRLRIPILRLMSLVKVSNSRSNHVPSNSPSP